MFRLGRASPGAIEAVLGSARASAPTYAAVGATRDGATLPPGFRHDQRTVDLVGPDCFERSRAGLRTWQAHRAAGCRVVPDRFGDGETVVVAISLGPVTVLAPCRIVYVVDEADRFGFAYGTLPGHPESGEESFVVERVGDDRARFTIRAFSRPREALVRLGGPVTRTVQRRTTDRYLDGLRRYAEGDGPG